MYDNWFTFTWIINIMWFIFDNYVSKPLIERFVLKL